MDSWEIIKEVVDAAKGVATFEAWQLRDAQGAGRLTERINGSILRSLGDRGMGAVPNQAHLMPTNQYELVRVYSRATPIGKVIDAALEPGVEQDRYLQETVDSTSADMLQQIRALVADA